MTHRLTTNYAKNYCNRTLIVKVIVENVVTCFLGHGVCMCVCRLLMCIKRACYTTKNKIMKLQMNKKKKQHSIIRKKHMQLDNETN